MAAANLAVKFEESNLTDIGDLPFVRMRKNPRKGEFPRDFWVVESAGSYEQGWQLGRQYGQLCVEYMRQEQFSGLLGWVVHDMQSKGRLGPIEHGFLEVFAQKALK